VVTDQLSPATWDLSTFELGEITFGDSTVTPPLGAQAFSTDVDLRPDKSVILWIDESLDRTSGMLTSTFSSRDPITGAPPDDPLLGFLPPDVLHPEGEGTISFAVTPLSTLPSGTNVENGARVVFDANPYIDTPIWSNLLDLDPPSSQVNSLTATQGSGAFAVSWSGSDAASGVLDFSVFVSDDGGPFGAWRVNTPLTSDTFLGQNNHVYSFYSVARDSAGNVEAPPSVPDATTQVMLGAGPASYELSFAGAVPNPGRAGGFVVAFSLPDQQPALIDVIDVAGRRVARRDVGSMGPGPHRLDLARGVRLAPGVYCLRLIRAGRVITHNAVLIH